VSMASVRWLLRKNRRRRAAEDLGLDDPFVSPARQFTGTNTRLLLPGMFPDRGGPTGPSRGEFRAKVRIRFINHANLLKV
jgi:hypothetical protein